MSNDVQVRLPVFAHRIDSMWLPVCRVAVDDALHRRIGPEALAMILDHWLAMAESGTVR